MFALPELLSRTLAPLAIIAVGFSMELKIGSDRSIFVKALALKLAILLAVFGIFWILGLESVPSKVTLLRSRCPL